MTLATLAAQTLQRTFNHCLGFDSLSRQRLLALQGRVIAIEFSDLAVQIYLCPEVDEVSIFATYEGGVDVTLRGTLLAFSRMAMADDSAEALFSGDIALEGDSALGQRFGEIIKELEIDWEEMASRLMGDVLAHKLGGLLRDGFAWSRDNVNSSQQTLAEYLQEELRLLPVKAEVEPFLEEVHTLRNDLDRVEARIRRLQHQPQDIENIT
ncbi:MAG: SCP2 sterol-binding domain-containing protein [Gammaproteobacteria bacterium]|nr:SCP2 sterol-binding domain-containing protein [Gammaproteobacteria bacterium]MCF6230989.1 SCP2 sterol-binding domain-containing protein [Gammaproteobacteria bacterium]